MKESYCIVDKRVTPCTEPSGYQKDKRGRTQFYCRCAVCGNKKLDMWKLEQLLKLEVEKRENESKKTKQPVSDGGQRYW